MKDTLDQIRARDAYGEHGRRRHRRRYITVERLSWRAVVHIGAGLEEGGGSGGSGRAWGYVGGVVHVVCGGERFEASLSEWRRVLDLVGQAGDAKGR